MRCVIVNDIVRSVVVAPQDTKMRVKTMPRQRLSQGSRIVEPESEIFAGKFEKPRQSSPSGEEKKTSKGEGDDSHASNEHRADDLNANQSEDGFANQEEEKEALNYSEEALDMSIKRKAESPENKLSVRNSIAGPSCCKYADSCPEGEAKNSTRSDDNNNVLTRNVDTEHCCSIAGCSSRDDSKSCENKSTTSSSDDEESVEAVNLCKKDFQKEDVSNPSGASGERLKDTFLYKIMTDPTFLENIQKHKQSKRYSCQFCKQEFVNSDELADHMDVKKDESNQVVCCACKKTFAQKRYLRYHQRCHSERTKFTCDICTKKYTRMDNLSRHNAFHVNPDKFSCTYCEKTFARKDLLNKHLKCHDNKYRFFCETCQKYFKGPLTLDNHRKNFHSVA